MFGSKAVQALAMRDMVNESHNRQASILDDLRQQLFDLNKKMLFRRSAKEALGELVREMLEEIDGRKPIRLSAPDATELRNSFYVDTMAKKVNSNAWPFPPAPDGTRIAMSKELIAEFKAKRQIK